MPAHRRSPGVVLAAVEAALRELGLTHLYLSACPLIGVLSVAPGVTAWCNGRMLAWRYGDIETRWPVTDTPGAAVHLAALAESVEVGE